MSIQSLDQLENEVVDPLVVAHDDADGITSAVLLVEGMGIDPSRVKFVTQFGEYITPHDIMLDMRPLDGFKGTCYDHHPDHPDNPPYKLIWDDVPTSLIVFNHFKDTIPKEHWWKVVVGVTGDGQAYKIPTYIWRMFPQLLLVTDSKYWSGSGYRTWSTSIYSRLSALINAAGRSRKPELAFNKLLEADTMDDLLGDTELEDLRVNLYRKIKDIVNKESKVYTIGPLRIVYYTAEEKIGGRVAAKLIEEGITIMTINEYSGEVSIRGDLTTLLVEELNKLGIGTFGGHAGYAGGELETIVGPSILARLLMNIMGGVNDG